MFFFIVCYISVSCTVFSVFCLSVWYVSALRTVCPVFCLTVCYVSVSRTFFSVFCLCYVGEHRKNCARGTKKLNDQTEKRETMREVLT